MADDRKQIAGLPDGWIWIYDKEETWTTSKGVKSTTRHAKNIFNDQTLSVGQVRKVQRTGQGLPATPRTERKGTVYTRTRESKFRGRTVSYSFRTLEEAQSFVFNDGVPEGYGLIAIQTKFKNSRIPGKDYKRYDSNGKLIRSRYASLSSYLRPSRWKNENAWDKIYDKASEFNFNQSSRFYVYATEQ